MALYGLLSNLPWIGGSSKLCAACQEGNLEEVCKLASPELVNVVGWMGWAPLHKAAQSGHAEVVQFLLSNSTTLKTDVNIRDGDNHTPLLLACAVPKKETKEPHLRIIHMLLEAKADVDAEDDGGYTALDVAVINNNIEAVKLLLQYKCNYNHQNLDRFTPLHFACRYHFQDIASVLVAAGADLTIPDGQGRTPIQLAQRYGIVLDLSSSAAESTTATQNEAKTCSASPAPSAPPQPNTPSTITGEAPHLAIALTTREPQSRIPAPPVSTEDVLRLQAEIEAELTGSS